MFPSLTSVEEAMTLKDNEVSSFVTGNLRRPNFFSISATSSSSSARSSFFIAKLVACLHALFPTFLDLMRAGPLEWQNPLIYCANIIAQGLLQSLLLDGVNLTVISVHGRWQGTLKPINGWIGRGSRRSCRTGQPLGTWLDGLVLGY